MAQRRFVTLEEFIIDTFTRIEEDGTEHAIDRPDEIGGAGSYAIIGARIFLPPERLGMIVDYTPDSFPDTMRMTLDSYGKDMLHYRQRTDGHPTCRAVNLYKGQLRIFDYLTKPSLLTPKSLRGTAYDNPLPTTIHIVPYIDRTQVILDELAELKRDHPGWSPIIVWEPEPPCCVPEHLDALRNFTPQMDVFSPNHTEVISLLSLPLPASSDDARETITAACVQLSSWQPKIATVIRAGGLGCCYLPSAATPSKDEVVWVPAYWSSDRPGHKDKVVDPTGAGNAFLGGLGAALDEGRDLHEAVLWATVAASFVIEQNGLPHLRRDASGAELWNSEDPTVRVEALRTAASAS